MSEINKTQGDSQPRKRRVLPIVGALAAGAIGGGLTVYGVTGDYSLGQTRPVTVAGVASCPEGEPVTGIWIEPQGGEGRGWAEWSPAEGQPNIAYYNRYIDPKAKQYEARVGCGGTPQQWEHSDISPLIANNSERVSVTCIDQAGVKIGSCVVAPMTR